MHMYTKDKKKNGKLAKAIFGSAEPYFWIIDLQSGFLEVMLAEFGEHKFLKFYPCSKIIFCNPSFKNLCSPN